MGKLIKLDENPQRRVMDFERQILESAMPEPAWEEDLAPPDPEAILAAAREEGERILREAYEEGIQRGREAGEQEFRAAVDSSVQALAQVSGAIQAAHRAFLDSLEPQVVSLVQSIAQRLLNREVRSDPELVAGTVREALNNIADRARLVVRLNPADLETVRNQKLSLLEDFDGVRQLDMMGDEGVSLGGCIVESELMQVDAQLDSQLERIFEAMME